MVDNIVRFSIGFLQEDSEAAGGGLGRGCGFVCFSAAANDKGPA
jgi:hypothetical protein